MNKKRHNGDNKGRYLIEQLTGQLEVPMKTKHLYVCFTESSSMSGSHSPGKSDTVAATVPV